MSLFYKKVNKIKKYLQKDKNIDYKTKIINNKNNILNKIFLETRNFNSNSNINILNRNRNSSNKIFLKY